MFSKIFSATTFLLALPALSSAAAVPAEMNELSTRGDNLCSSYSAMTLGELLLENRSGKTATLSWAYKDDINSGFSFWFDSPSFDVPGSKSQTFVRSTALRGINTDRLFQLQVCDLASSNTRGTCTSFGTFFQIPGNTKAAQWPANVTYTGTGKTPSCIVGTQLKV